MGGTMPGLGAPNNFNPGLGNNFNQGMMPGFAQ